MTPTILVVIAVIAALAIAIYALRRLSRHGRPADLGVVSTRWISELRRDEPWTRS
jgi:hypothetical protein